MPDTLSLVTETGGRGTSADYGNLLICRGCKRTLRVPTKCPICVRTVGACCLLRATHQGIRGEPTEARRGCTVCARDAWTDGLADPREEDA